MANQAELDYAEQFGVTFPVYLTQQDYENLPSGPFQDELIDEELIVSPFATSRHTLLIEAIREALAPLKQSGYAVLLEAGIQLSAAQSQTGKSSTIGPDLAVFDKARFLTESRQHTYARHVLLAIEVIPLGSTKREMERKIEEYFRLSAHEVWIVERDKGVCIWRADGTVAYVERGVVSTPHPLPRIDIDFERIFTEV